MAGARARRDDAVGDDPAAQDHRRAELVGPPPVSRLPKSPKMSIAEVGEDLAVLVRRDVVADAQQRPRRPRRRSGRAGSCAARRGRCPAPWCCPRRSARCRADQVEVLVGGRTPTRGRSGGCCRSSRARARAAGRRRSRSGRSRPRLERDVVAGAVEVGGRVEPRSESISRSLPPPCRRSSRRARRCRSSGRARRPRRRPRRRCARRRSSRRGCAARRCRSSASRRRRSRPCGPSCRRRPRRGRCRASCRRRRRCRTRAARRAGRRSRRRRSRGSCWAARCRRCPTRCRPGRGRCRPPSS